MENPAVVGVDNDRPPNASWFRGRLSLIDLMQSIGLLAVILLGSAGGVWAAVSIAPMFLIVAISALELLVAFLQAYVFAILTCIYLNEALHLHDQH